VRWWPQTGPNSVTEDEDKPSRLPLLVPFEAPP
jgi:hypothetical protein